MLNELFKLVNFLNLEKGEFGQVINMSQSEVFILYFSKSGVYWFVMWILYISSMCAYGSVRNM